VCDWVYQTNGKKTWLLGLSLWPYPWNMRPERQKKPKQPITPWECEIERCATCEATRRVLLQIHLT
jgi:hypothetical protein